jgi:hypothetical protein
MQRGRRAALGLLGVVALLTLPPGLSPRSPARAEAACPESWYVPTLVTNTSQGLPQDQDAFALVLLAEPDFRHEAYRNGPFANGFALTRRGHRVPLIVDELGVGVARLRAATPLSLGLWRVEGLPTAASINIVGGATLPPPPAAPNANEVSLTMPRVRAQAAMSDTPREVVAHFEPTTQRSPILLGYWDGELGAAARVRQQDDRVTLFRPLRCGDVRPGVRPPAPNAVRELAWLDGFGRVSPRYRVP